MIFYAFLASLFTFSITTLGSAIVFFFKKNNQTILSITLGISGGIMLAASFFSLINPAIILCDKINLISWLVISIGIILGGIFLYFSNKILTKKKIKYGHILNLIWAILLHNIPEGLAIGVAFGSIIYNIDGATLGSAITLAIGIGIQNFPEGSAVSLPLKQIGYSRKKAFLIGMLTGSIELLAAPLGALLAIKTRLVLPYLLSFAAGAMIYVVSEDIIPEAAQKKNIVGLTTIIGFIIMMILDIALG